MTSQELRRTLLWVVGGLLVCALAARWVLELPDSAPASGSFQHTLIRRPSAPTGSAPLLVHVAGLVRHPGVYRLAAGARTFEAILAAGGAAKGSDQNSLSLAARVADGATIVVQARRHQTTDSGSASPAIAAASSGPAASGSPISLSSATVEQLDQLDGIGPALAKRIVEWRDAHGGFGSVADLDGVPGIGPAKLAALKGAVVP